MTSRPAPTRGVLLGGESVPRNVEALAPSVPRTAPPSGMREALQSLGVPVLFSEASHEAGVRTDYFHGDGWYAWTLHEDGYRVHLHASTKARLIPGLGAAPPPSDTVRELRGTIARNEAIWTVSWLEQGIAFALDLECDDPTAPPCDDDRHVTTWVDALVWADIEAGGAR